MFPGRDSILDFFPSVLAGGLFKSIFCFYSPLEISIRRHQMAHGGCEFLSMNHYTVVLSADGQKLFPTSFGSVALASSLKFKVRTRGKKGKTT